MGLGKKDYYTKQFHVYIYKLLIYNQIERILTKVHKCYPQLFTEDDYDKEKENLEKCIKSMTINFIVKEPLKKERKPRNKLIGPRCVSRVFDLKFLIYSDKNPGKKIYGRRCKNRIISNTKYCGIHKRHNPHGDFDKDISQVMRNHFLMHKQTESKKKR